MPDDPDLSHRLTLLGLAAFSAVWITAVGACVGSFLNVVVWRLPLGMSLVRPKSRCPACGTPIRTGDNIPIFGWLRLRGRCRACGGAISPRYPLVEAATAILFLGLAHFELFSGGANLPGGPERSDGLSFVLWHLRPELLALYAYHILLLTTLLALSLIVWDGFPPPRRLLLPVLFLGLAAPFLLILHPVNSGIRLTFLPTTWTSPWKLAGYPLTLFPHALFDGLIGLALGTLVGLAVSLAVPSGPRRPADRRGTLAAGALIGLFLGWQAAVSCGLAAALFSLPNAAASRLIHRPLPTTTLLALAAALQLALWRDLCLIDWWPAPAGWNLLRPLGWPDTAFAFTTLAAALVVTALTARIAGFATRAHDLAAPSLPPLPGKEG